MPCREMVLNIANGYQIIEHKKTMGIDTAGAWLASKKRDNLTEASRDDLKATLIWHGIRCPYCGKETPAYLKAQTGKANVAHVTEEAVEGWAMRQISLFPGQEKVLRLNKVYEPKKGYICPFCNGTLPKASRDRKVRIVESKNKIAISTELTDLGELASTTWFITRMFRFDGIAHETLTFNFRNGHTFIKLEDNGGKLLAIKDITQCPGSLCDGAIYSLFSQSKYFNRTLRHMFLTRYNGKLPFSSCELSMEKFVLMTEFVGYGRSFYDAIPYAEGSQKIDVTFRSTAKKLHSSNKVADIYRLLGLPQMKSLKRLIFTKPGLLFYSAEIKELWETLQSPDLLRTILKSKKCYQILSDLHVYQGIFRFYADYLQAKGRGALCRLIIGDTEAIHTYAVFYSAMCPDRRKHEQIKWSDKDMFDRIKQNTDYRGSALRTNEKHSVPMQNIDDKITCCVIDGYSFVWLRNLMECKRAGFMLTNCLVNWRSQDNPVVAVVQNHMILAAIEVEGMKVRQARISGNQDIFEDIKLFKAYRKWLERFELEFCPCDWEEEFADVLF